MNGQGYQKRIVPNIFSSFNSPSNIQKRGSATEAATESRWITAEFNGH